MDNITSLEAAMLNEIRPRVELHGNLKQLIAYHISGAFSQEEVDCLSPIVDKMYVFSVDSANDKKIQDSMTKYPNVELLKDIQLRDAHFIKIDGHVNNQQQTHELKILQAFRHNLEINNPWLLVRTENSELAPFLVAYLDDLHYMSYYFIQMDSFGNMDKVWILGIPPLVQEALVDFVEWEDAHKTGHPRQSPEKAAAAQLIIVN